MIKYRADEERKKTEERLKEDHVTARAQNRAAMDPAAAGRPSQGTTEGQERDVGRGKG